MKIPWPTKKIGEVVDFISGNQNINKEKAVLDGMYPAFSAAGQDIFLDTYEHEGSAIIVSWIGARCGKCFLANGKWTAIANTQILKIKDEKKCDYKYLFYFLNDETKWPRVGGAQPYISKNDAKRIEIPLPPIEIQKRIVARIEELFEKIDRAIELRKKAKEETEQIFQSAVQEVFSEAEKKWERKKLHDPNVAEVIMGQSPPSNTYNKDGRGLLFYQGKIDFGEIYLNPSRKWCSKPIKIALKGDILISVRAPVGPTNICTEKICIGRGLAAVRPKQELNNFYLLYWFRYKEPEIIGQGTTFGAIKRNYLERLEIPLPPISEQKKIVSYLNNLREKVDKLKRVQEEQLKELEELKKSILEKAFSGELI
ncbi:MAG: restriction endonuclease subunit S [Candidatus Omnitrophica bacterium]|nr:restriction endonuclease subunit S [Candidatus Omnitrophota bacterium]